jgi:hypothetical protein
MLMNAHSTGQWALKHLDPEHQETEKPDNDVMGMDDLKKLRPIYNQLKDYNKNVFPIKGFNINGIENINDFLWALKQREKIINIFTKWPSIAKRNMKDDIRRERDGSEMNHYRDSLEHADSYISLLNNRNENARRKIEAKIFTNNTTLDNVMDFLYDKESLLGGTDLTRKQIGQILKDDKENANELKVKYNKGNIMIIEVSGSNGIKEIGCNSLWCFTYNRKGGSTNWEDWSRNSTNGYCYIIIDFSEPFLKKLPLTSFAYEKTWNRFFYKFFNDDYFNVGRRSLDRNFRWDDDKNNSFSSKRSNCRESLKTQVPAHKSGRVCLTGI